MQIQRVGNNLDNTRIQVIQFSNKFYDRNTIFISTFKPQHLFLTMHALQHVVYGTVLQQMLVEVASDRFIYNSITKSINFMNIRKEMYIFNQLSALRPT